jgi:hypothetical protein
MEKIKPALFSLLLTILLLGCSDDENGPQNSITLNGSSFKITTATLIGISIDGEGHAAISFSNVTNTSNKNLTIDFEYSPNQTLSGTYSFPQGNNRYLDDFLTNYSEFINQGFYSTELEEGTLTLTDHGNSNYTVTIDLTMLDGKVFSGTYKGKIASQFQNS